MALPVRVAEDNVMSADTNVSKHYHHKGFSATISDSYSAPSSTATGITWDGTNVISASQGAAKHYLHSGFSATISNSYSSPSTTPRGITWDGTNVISADSGTADKHYLHSGFSATISNSYSSPSTTPTGITWDGTNVISCDSAADKHYLHSGFSATISNSYSSPDNVPNGIGWDGTNVISTGWTADKHYLHSGFSATISDSYSSPDLTPAGITWAINAVVGAFPTQNSYVGPFKSSAGNFYTILLDSTDISQLEAWKATDPASSFSIVGTNPNLTNNVVSMWCEQEGDLVHVAHQETSTGRIGRSTFNMSSDSWTTSDQAIETPANAPGANDCSIAHRSDGDLIVLYNGDTDKDMGTEYDRVDYAWWNGSSWSAGNTVVTDMTSFAVGTDMTGAVIVRGSSDRMHFFFSDITNADVYIRTLSGAATPALESMTFGSGAFDATAGGLAHGWFRGVSYHDGTNHRVHCCYVDSGGTSLSAANFTSADAPTYGSPITGLNTQGATQACFASADDDVHLLFCDNQGSQDLRHDVNDDEGGWGTDTILIDVSANSNYTSIDAVSANIYDRDGVGAVIGILVDDNGTIKYTEASDGSNDNAVDINKSYSTFATVALRAPLYNSRFGPFYLPGGSDRWYSFVTGENYSFLAAMKATTTPSTQGNWSSQDDPILLWRCAADPLTQRTGGPGSQDRISCVHVAIYNRRFHIATQQTSGRVAYHVFDPATDTWTTRDETVVLAGATNFDLTPLIWDASLAMRSNGEPLIVAAYGSSGFYRLRVFDKPSGSWVNRGAASQDTANTDYINARIVGPDSNGRVSWAYKDHTNSDVLLQSILGTTISGVTTADSDIDTGLTPVGIADQRISDNRFYFPYVDADDTLSIYTAVSGSTPSGGSNTTGVSDNTVWDSGATLQYLGIVVRDNEDLLVLYVRESDSDIYRDRDTGGGFGTDALVTGTVTAIALSMSVYDDTLMWHYEDSDSQIDYDEEVQTAETALSDLNGLNTNFPAYSLQYAGPFYASAALYIPHTRNGNDLIMMKSTTDPSTDATFTQTGGKVIVSNDDGYNKAIQAMHAWLDGTTIHVLTMTSTGQVQYSTYLTASDAWSVQGEVVFEPFDISGSLGPDTVFTVSGASRADGDVVAVFNYLDANGFSRLRVYTRESGTWTDRGSADGGTASTDYFNAYCVGPDSSDRITWVYLASQAVDLMLNSISSANSVAGETQVDASTGSGTWIAGQPVINSNTIYCLYYDFASTLSIASWTSGASPTPSITTGVSDGAAQYSCLALRASNGDRYAVFRLTSDADLYYDVDTGSGFGTDISLVSTITNAQVPGLSARINAPFDTDLDVLYYNSADGEWHYATVEVDTGAADAGPKVNSLMLVGAGI